MGMACLAWPAPALACSHDDTPICPGDETTDAFVVATYLEDITETIAGKINEAFGDDSFIGGILDLQRSLEKEINSWFGVESSNKALKIMSEGVSNAADTARTDALISANIETQIAALGAETAANTGVSAGGADQFLCNRIKVEQAVPVMEEFARMVASIITTAIDSTYLGQGTGPRYWTDQALLQCGMAKGFALAVGNPVSGIPAVCRAPFYSAGISDADMNIMSTTLGRRNSYTLPSVESKTIKENGIEQDVLIFAPASEDEAVLDSMNRWMQAAQYCYIATNFRPPGPYGDAKFTPDGIPKMDKYNTCRARQNVFTYQCAYRLGTLTRPNCADKNMAAFCEAAKDACIAAKGANLNLGQEYANCQNGLSLAQFENIATQMCAASRRIQSDMLGGLMSPEALMVLARCNESRQDWLDSITLQDRAFSNALKGLQEIEACFQEADKM